VSYGSSSGVAAGRSGSARPRILVVEDEAKTAAAVRRYLEHAGFATDVAADGRSGLDRALSGRYVLVVLDLNLPGLDGRAVCRRLRAEGSCPVVMLTARAGEDDRVDGLDLGADDYVTKPFSPRELVARVRAVLRRTAPEGLAEGGRRRWQENETQPEIEVDLDAFRTLRRGSPVELTATETRLLWTLLGAPGRVFSRDELVERVLGRDFEGSERTVDVHVRNLRRKLEEDPSRPRLVQTVFGVGYRLGGGAP